MSGPAAFHPEDASSRWKIQALCENILIYSGTFLQLAGASGSQHPPLPAFQMIFIGNDTLGIPLVFSNAREYVNCGNMQAKGCGFIVLQKRFY